MREAESQVLIEVSDKFRKLQLTRQAFIVAQLAEETAREAGTAIDETRRVLAMSRYPISLDRPVGNSEDSHFGDLLPDSDAESPAVGAAQEMLRSRIGKVLKTLSYREREIIKLRYGLGDGYSYTLEETGRIFQVTRERIRQIESKALRKMQHETRSRHLHGFVENLARGADSDSVIGE